MEADDAFVLFVGEKQDIHLAFVGQVFPHIAHVSVALLAAAAQPQVYRILGALEALVLEKVAEIVGGLALGFSADRQVEEHHHPHQAVAGKHGNWGAGGSKSVSRSPMNTWASEVAVRSMHR